MSLWTKGHPVAKCGRNPWYCEYDSTDPNCCQYDPERMKRNKHVQWMHKNKEELDKEYGKMEEGINTDRGSGVCDNSDNSGASNAGGY